MLLAALLLYLMLFGNISKRKKIASQLGLNYIKGNSQDIYNIVEGKYKNRSIKVYDKYMAGKWLMFDPFSILVYLPKIEIDNKLVYTHWGFTFWPLSSKKIKKIIDKNIDS